MSEMLNNAISYAKRGWHVFPVKPKAKIPLTTHGFKDATTDESTIEKWWQRWPGANIGVACGPSRLVVIDIDAYNGGSESWEDLGISDDTVTSLTGGGGIHLLFVAPDGVALSNSAGKLGAGVDVRANGGYIIVPPSIHPNGREYAWEISSHPDDRKPAALPDGLRALLMEPAVSVAPIPNTISEGQRNTLLTSLAGSMRRRGAGEASILAALTAENARCDRPLSADELGTIAQSVARYEPEVQEFVDPRWDTKKGAPKTADYIAALGDLDYRFKMNICNDVVELNSEPMSDTKRSKIRSQMRDLNYLRVNVMEDAWIAHAYDNRYHPVRVFLDGVTWDGEDHIVKLASHFTDEHGYFGMFLTRWLIGSVARACEKRSCQNRMLILDGAQGIGKSEFVRWLAGPTKRPELFIEGPIRPDDKDDLIRLITTWIWEVSELGSTTRRSDRESLKYFLSLQQVTVRKPYGHYDLVKPALSAFIGTVNNVAGFLDDPTGYRRFMTCHITAIDWTYTEKVDPRQVWAQAKALYDKGQPWELTKQEIECAKFANAQYEIEDPLHDIFLRNFELTGKVTDFAATVDILRQMREDGWRLRSPRAESMAVANLMRRLKVSGVRFQNERGYEGVKELLPLP